MAKESNYETVCIQYNTISWYDGNIVPFNAFARKMSVWENF